MSLEFMLIRLFPGRLHEHLKHHEDAIHFMTQFLDYPSTDAAMAYFVIGNSLESNGSTFDVVFAAYSKALMLASNEKHQQPLQLQIQENIEFISVLHGRVNEAREARSNIRRLEGELERRFVYLI